jgi:hypothetical protein
MKVAACDIVVLGVKMELPSARMLILSFAEAL